MREKRRYDVTVLRLVHRPYRDKRISTHLLLAARALGARRAIYTGTRDPSLEESVRKIVADWGGDFTISYSESWKKVVKAWEGKIVHLTMYGVPIYDVIQNMREDISPKLIVVGGAKVPGEMYQAANWNVAVTGQPHSEVSALAIFLYELSKGATLKAEYPNARLRVIPKAHGKFVEHRQSHLRA